MRAAYLALTVFVLLIVALAMLAAEGPAETLSTVGSGDVRAADTVSEATDAGASAATICPDANAGLAMTGCPADDQPTDLGVSVRSLRRIENEPPGGYP